VNNQWLQRRLAMPVDADARLNTAVTANRSKQRQQTAEARSTD